jgi:hypothetical protein
MTLASTVTGTITVGQVLTGTAVSTGTYIVANIAGGTGNGSTWTVSVSQQVSSTTITSTSYQLTVSGPSSAVVQVGGALSGGSIPANTYVVATNAQNASLTGTGGAGTYMIANIAGTSVTNAMTPTSIVNYAATLNQATTAAVPLTSTTGTTVNFSRNTYALPGETVFSYINAPANKDALDLTALKELTNTPIGGRGCYPNGCDIMFINAYITQGNPINQNLVLRWGEAQA